jgi:predicted O-methyltransferase YrrM
MKHHTHFSADWFTGHAEHWLRLLGHLRDRPVRALEIGSYEGRSACWLLDNLLVHPESKLWCVDPWDGTDPCLEHKTTDAEDLFDGNVRFYGERVLKVRKTSLEFLTTTLAVNPARGLFDLVFVDGDHEGYSALTDLVLSWPLLAPGGTLAFDDYGWSDPRLRAQPRDAWDAWASCKPPGLAEVVQAGRQVFARKEG